MAFYTIFFTCCVSKKKFKIVADLKFVGYLIHFHANLYFLIINALFSPNIIKKKKFQSYKKN